MSNATLEQTEMRISPQLKRFGKLVEEIDKLLDNAEDFGHSFTTQLRYHQARRQIAEFELKACRKNMSNERTSAYFVLTDYLREQTKERYEKLMGVQK